MKRCLLLLLLLFTGCTSMVPRENLFYPLVTSESPLQVKTVVVPLPVIAASPNEGVTGGALAAFLLHNSNDEVATLIAPQVNYNPNFDTTYTIYGAFYPHKDRSIEVNLSRSGKVNDDYEVKLRDATLLAGKLELNLFPYHFTDGSSRFYGLGPGSVQGAETNFASRESGFTMTASYRLFGDIFLLAGDRLRDVTIAAGAFDALPSITAGFNEQTAPGINGATVHGQKFGLFYNSLDSQTMPTVGAFARSTAEFFTSALGSDREFQRYEAEVKGIIPADRQKRFITAARASYSHTAGSRAPFFEQGTLGGETTLRGYGRNRFIDSSALLFNLEERIRLFRWQVFDVTADWELAPFLDAGAVSGTRSGFRGGDFRFTPGFGLRAVVRPNIVGRMDIGWSGEGVAVFVGLGYPF
ncbi:MAG: hypothetical protein FIA91_07100 [Geobacter sp.]|nr:hypothetical protein [Geobacter sp.]